MRIFPTPKIDGYLDLVSVLQEIADQPRLELEIVLANFRFETHLLEGLRLLALPRLAFFPGLLVLELTVVQEAAYWGCRRWAYLDQIEVGCPGQLERTRERNDSKLFTGLSDESYFARPDLIIYSEVFRDDLTSLGMTVPP